MELYHVTELDVIQSSKILLQLKMMSAAARCVSEGKVPVEGRRICRVCTPRGIRVYQ